MTGHRYFQRYVFGATAVCVATVGLSGCQSAVKLQFQKPDPGTDPQKIAALAKAGYSYFVLPKDYVVVAPTSSADQNSPKGTKNDPADDTGNTSNSDPTKSTGDSGAAAAEKHTAGNQLKSKDTAGKGGKKPATTTPAKTGGTDTGDKSKDTQDGSKKPAAAGGNNDSPPPVFSNALATITIDGASWTAKAAPMPDTTQAYLVKGVQGFFESTTLGVGHYQNSDLVSSVSSTAENLVPTRVGQIASIVASVISIAAAVGVSGGGPETKLQPFTFEVPKDKVVNANLDDYWHYDFLFEPDAQPSGTVTLDQWQALIANQAKVNYWPVPACRNAVLNLYNKDLQAKKQSYHFEIIVASQQYVRLEPLPVSGKINMGTVCGSSTNGGTTGDTLGNVTDDLSAVQKAIKTIQSAQKSKGSGS